MQLPIKKMFTNDITTMYGQKQKFDIYVDTAQGEFKFSAWVGNWNKAWQPGTQIEVPSGEDSRWKKREHQGKTYLTLGAPPEAMQSFGGASTPAMPQAPVEAPAPTLDAGNAFGSRMNEVEQRLIVVEKRIDDSDKEISDMKFDNMEKAIKEDKVDIPIVSADDDGISIADVPF